MPRPPRLGGWAAGRRDGSSASLYGTIRSGKNQVQG
ncbi:hypothetical protein PENANT_c001G09721 [Penicillium antarcticum]|uniref:Uncharacterized protein n=1 Tax=Penicillium antarcticum TaxID=416450 RepID=A0A1V6QNV9_9EURO|nr:hypothetical protein PENANT_c001G09721 [Penicillium antarcticum]